MVSAQLNNISQIRSFPQERVNIKKKWNHHLDIILSIFEPNSQFSRPNPGSAGKGNWKMSGLMGTNMLQIELQLITNFNLWKILGPSQRLFQHTPTTPQPIPPFANSERNPSWMPLGKGCSGCVPVECVETTFDTRPSLVVTGVIRLL